VSALLIIGVTWNDVKFLTSYKTVSYTKRTALYVVIYVPVKHLFLRGSSIRNESDIYHFFGLEFRLFTRFQTITKVFRCKRNEKRMLNLNSCLKRRRPT
jgi:hypothetical protein